MTLEVEEWLDEYYALTDHLHVMQGINHGVLYERETRAFEYVVGVTCVDLGGEA